LDVERLGIAVPAPHLLVPKAAMRREVVEIVKSDHVSVALRWRYSTVMASS